MPHLLTAIAFAAWRCTRWVTCFGHVRGALYDKLGGNVRLRKMHELGRKMIDSGQIKAPV
jgi:hypothetical protein